MMKYPDYNVYDVLYRNYFARNPKELIDLAFQNGLKENSIVADFCGGGGRLTNLLNSPPYNLKVVYVDQESKMIPKNLNATVYNCNVEKFIHLYKNKLNAIFCQNAVTYWFNKINVKDLHDKLEQNGLFVFNSFLTKPPFTPTIKKYQLQDKNYAEISYSIDDKIFHVQTCEGYEPHFTVFDYISENQFIEKLNSYFDVKVVKSEKTGIFICQRRD